MVKDSTKNPQVADESSLSGHKVSARDGYLRASNYYRAAEFLLIDPEDPRILETWGRSKECFNKAAELFSSTVESIEIPYEGTSLPGHIYTVDGTKIEDQH